MSVPGQSCLLAAVALLVSAGGAGAVFAADPPAQFSPTKPVEVFIAAGQSNMAGAGNLHNMPMSIRSQVPASSIPGWYHTNLLDTKGWIEATDPNHLFGPELGFASKISKQQPDTQVAVVKFAWAGSPIDSFATPGRWHHDAMLAMIQSVKADLDARKAAGTISGYRFAGFLWMQGESEADGMRYWYNNPHYYDNMVKLTDDVRDVTGVPDLPVVLGRTSIQISPSFVRSTGLKRYAESYAKANGIVDGNGSRIFPWDDIDYANDGIARGPIAYDINLQNVRNEQTKFASLDGHASLVDVDDLQMSDPFHYTGESYWAMGNRFADTYIAAVPEPTSVCVLVLGAFGLLSRRRLAASL